MKKEIIISTIIYMMFLCMQVFVIHKIGKLATKAQATAVSNGVLASENLALTKKLEQITIENSRVVLENEMMALNAEGRIGTLERQVSLLMNEVK